MRYSSKRRLGQALFAAGVALYLLATGAVAFAGLPLSLVGSFMMIAYTDPDAARHWRRLNVFFRLAGIAFTSVGIAFIGWTVHDFVFPDRASMGDGPAWLGLAVGGAVAGLGVLMLRAPAIRPDLGDSPTSDRWMRVFWGLPSNWSRPVAPGRQSRTWWTGDTKPPTNSVA